MYKYGNTKIYYISPFDIFIDASVNKIAFTTNWHKPFAKKDNYGQIELIIIDINGKILSTEIYKERRGFESFWDGKDLKYIRTKKNPCRNGFIVMK